MNTKTSSIISIAVIAAIIGFSVYLNFYQKPMAGKLAVEPMKDGKGIYVGDASTFGMNKPGPNASLESIARWKKHQEDLKAISEAGALTRTGDAYVNSGNYEEAIAAYKKAYKIDRGDRMYVGFILIPIYERLHRYDEALALLDEMEREFQLSEKGKQDFAATRTRLLAAKEEIKQ